MHLRMFEARTYIRIHRSIDILDVSPDNTEGLPPSRYLETPVTQLELTDEQDQHYANAFWVFFALFALLAAVFGANLYYLRRFYSACFAACWDRIRNGHGLTFRLRMEFADPPHFIVRLAVDRNLQPGIEVINSPSVIEEIADVAAAAAVTSPSAIEPSTVGFFDAIE